MWVLDPHLSSLKEQAVLFTANSVIYFYVRVFCLRVCVGITESQASHLTRVLGAELWVLCETREPSLHP